MIITIDATYTLSNKTGIGYYIYYLINALQKNDIKNKYQILYNCVNPFKHKYIKILNKNFSNKIIYLPRRYFLKLWNNKIFKYLFFRNTNIFFNTGLHISNFKTNVSMIYDLSFKKDNLSYSKEEQKKLDLLINKILKNSKRIITTSEITKKDILAYYNYPEKHIKVIYGGLPEVITNFPENYKIEIPFERYFLFIGSIEKRKNLSLILYSISLLENANLIIIGKPGNDSSNTNKLIKKLNLENKVYFTGYVTDIEKNYLLKSCEALLYPSLYEGYGIPILEAYRHKKLVVTTKVGSIPEIAGNAAIYIENNKLELKTILKKILNKEITETEYLEKIKKQLEKFSWEKTSKKLIDFFEGIK